MNTRPRASAQTSHLPGRVCRAAQHKQLAAPLTSGNPAQNEEVFGRAARSGQPVRNRARRPLGTRRDRQNRFQGGQLEILRLPEQLTSAIDQRYLADHQSFGIIAYLRLWFSTDWKLALPTEFFDRMLHPSAAFELHQTISLLALAGPARSSATARRKETA